MALVSLEGMEFFAYHGCFDEEQIIGNKYIVDVFIDADLNEAQKTDDLDKTIDYQAVYMLIQKEMEIKSKLIEHVASRIIDSICNQFPTVVSTKVKVSKLNPPLKGKTERVSITLYQDNTEEDKQ